MAPSEEPLDDTLFIGLCASYGGASVEESIYKKLLAHGFVKPRASNARRTWLTDLGRQAYEQESRRRDLLSALTPLYLLESAASEETSDPEAEDLPVYGKKKGGVRCARR